MLGLREIAVTAVHSRHPHPTQPRKLLKMWSKHFFHFLQDVDRLNFYSFKPSSPSLPWPPSQQHCYSTHNIRICVLHQGKYSQILLPTKLPNTWPACSGHKCQIGILSMEYQCFLWQRNLPSHLCFLKSTLLGEIFFLKQF